MENQTSFDLSQEIQRWRDNLAQSPAISRDSLDEMESHLRDSTAGLQASGLSVEESFLIARKRMDGNGGLEAEFRKINGRTVWMRKLAMFALVAIVFLIVGAGITGSIVRWGRLLWAASLLSQPSSGVAAIAPSDRSLERTFIFPAGGEWMRANMALVILDSHSGEIVAMVGENGSSPENLQLALERLILRKF